MRQLAKAIILIFAITEDLMFKGWLNCYIDIFSVFTAQLNVIGNFAKYTDGYILPDIHHSSIKLHDIGQTLLQNMVLELFV